MLFYVTRIFSSSMLIRRIRPIHTYLPSVPLYKFSAVIYKKLLIKKSVAHEKNNISSFFDEKNGRSSNWRKLFIEGKSRCKVHQLLQALNHFLNHRKSSLISVCIWWKWSLPLQGWMSGTQNQPVQGIYSMHVLQKQAYY